MANHHQWPYRRLDERWQIAAAGLQVLAAALAHSPKLACGVRKALAQQGTGVVERLLQLVIEYTVWDACMADFGTQ